VSAVHVEEFQYSLLLPDGKRNSRAIKVCVIHILEVAVLILFLPLCWFINGLFNDSGNTTEWTAANGKVVAQ